MDKPEQFPVEEILNEGDRLARGWGSVEVRDSQGELLPMSEFKKIMPIIMSRGGMIMDTHSNRGIGKIINYEFKEHPKTGEEGVMLTYKVFSDFETDNQVWDEIKENKRTGLSFGGRAHKSKFQFDNKGRLENTTKILYELEGFEFSSVAKPANKDSLNTQVNYLAKGDANKMEDIFKPEDDRPPKAWWDACTGRAEGFADDPARFCGALWARSGEFPGGGKLRESFGKSQDDCSLLLKQAIVEFEKKQKEEMQMGDISKEEFDKVSKALETMSNALESVTKRLDALEKQKPDEEEDKKPKDEEEKKKQEEEDKKLKDEEEKEKSADAKELEGVKKELSELKKSFAGLSVGGEAKRPETKEVNKGGKDKTDKDYALKVARGEAPFDIRKHEQMLEEKRDELVAKALGEE